MRELLAGLIDYAGVFPPAALPLDQALTNYARYQTSPEAWMLGRFVLPVAQVILSPAKQVRFSAIVGDGDLDKIPPHVDSIEMKVSTPAQIESAAARISKNVTTYFEITDLTLLPVIRAVGARAKSRTGGITPDAFPPASQIAEFLVACARANVAFKATAGLHHPLRCYRPLTYAADGPSGWMYGFLNVFTAAIFARRGVTNLEQILLAESPDDLPRVDDPGEVAAVRRDFAISFGSCSFEEPVADLKALRLI
ncbi:MAG TPA: hypothetical protein VGP79_07600 [Bryobacteraceae bacterium]|nr:hypothetical protein [Bryobacteraceae bacterium]